MKGELNLMKRKQKDRKPEKYNTAWQYYKGIPVKLIVYTEQHFAAIRAKRYLLGKSGGQNIWIPNSCLLPDGTLNPALDLDWIFQRAYQENKFRYASINIDPSTWLPPAS